MKKLLFITLLALSTLQISSEIFAMKQDDKSEQDKSEESKKRKTEDPTHGGQAPAAKHKKEETLQDHAAAVEAATAPQAQQAQQMTVAATTGSTTDSTTGSNAGAIQYFDSQPDFIIMLILSFCDLKSLGKAAQTCKRFSTLAKEPEVLIDMLENLLSCNNVERPTSLVRLFDIGKILTQYPNLKDAARFEKRTETVLKGIMGYFNPLEAANKYLYLEEVLKTGFDNSSMGPITYSHIPTNQLLLFFKYCCYNIISTKFELLTHVSPEDLIHVSPEDLIDAIAIGSNFAISIGKQEKFKKLFTLILTTKCWANKNILEVSKINPILIAAQEGAILFTLLLMPQNFNILSTDKDGNSVLHIAIQNNQNKFVEWVLSLDEKIVNKLLNRSNKDGITPIQTAIRKNHIAIVTQLINRGAKSVTDYNGNTLLHHAVESGSLSMVRFILDHGGENNVYTTNNIGINPITLADGLGYTEISGLLRTIKPKQEPTSSSQCFVQ